MYIRGKGPLTGSVIFVNYGLVVGSRETLCKRKRHGELGELVWVLED